MAGSDSTRKPKKTMKAVPHETFSNMWKLVFEEGGKVPTVLGGMYKSKAKAALAIRYYNDGFDRDNIQPRAPREKPEVKEEVLTPSVPSVPKPPAPPKTKRSVKPDAKEKIDS